jgi:hypothetical protein
LTPPLDNLQPVRCNTGAKKKKKPAASKKAPAKKAAPAKKKPAARKRKV